MPTTNESNWNEAYPVSDSMLTVQKLQQVKPSDSLSYPAYIVVVDFSTPLSRVIER